MTRTAIVADSTADIPEGLAEKYNIHICPTYVIWSGETFRDRFDLSFDAFYERLASDPELPTTSQPAPGEYLKVYEHLAAEGYEAAVTTTVTGVHSGTYNVAMTAAEMAPFPVHVVDSRSVGAGQFLIAMAAAEARDAGAEPDEIADAAREAVPACHVFFTLDELDYLHKGGRIGSLQHFLGSLLNIKPIFTVNDGHIEMMGRVRSRRKALRTLIKKAQTYHDPQLPVQIAGAMHGACPKDLPALSKMVKEAFHPELFFDGRIGPTLGVHTGPSIIGAGFLQR